MAGERGAAILECFRQNNINKSLQIEFGKPSARGNSVNIMQKREQILQNVTEQSFVTKEHKITMTTLLSNTCAIGGHI